MKGQSTLYYGVRSIIVQGNPADRIPQSYTGWSRYPVESDTYKTTVDSDALPGRGCPRLLSFLSDVAIDAEHRGIG